MKRILFVCTGNTCRSPMAEGIFKNLLKDRGLSDRIRVQSAGLSVFREGFANPNALMAMEEMNIDISQHQSMELTPMLIENADIILTMTQGHKRQILIAMPQASHKVYTLCEFIDQGELDILDPFGMPLEEYQRTAQELEKALEKALEKIVGKFFA